MATTVVWFGVNKKSVLLQFDVVGARHKYVERRFCVQLIRRRVPETFAALATSGALMTSFAAKLRMSLSTDLFRHLKSTRFLLLAGLSRLGMIRF